MSRRNWAVVVVAWLFSLIAVAVLAQAPGITPLQKPVILAGPDIAFRVDGTKGGKPVGTLIVRYDGHWWAPEAAQGPIRLAAR